jgi:putative YhdH/YhfP family quinone oxidoreductase
MIETDYRAIEAVRADDGRVEWGAVDLPPARLQGPGVLVRVHHSGVNFKDALAVTGGRVVREYPIVPGIDLAGTVVESDGSDFPIGTDVLAHGYTLGTGRDGGYAQYARVPSEYLVRLGELTSRDAMAIGTAGFTAAMSVIALIDGGVTPDSGPVLVTGASGGVGTVSVDLLASRGYQVVASTGKSAAGELLTGIGAAEVVGRLPDDPDAPIRPLGTSTWAGVIDCVGGRTLAHALSTTAYGGVVAASGLTGGAELVTTVMPFILRAVTLRGIDSVQLGIDERRQLWGRLGSDLRPSHIDDWATEVQLDGIGPAFERVLGGNQVGRTVVALP